MAEVHGILCAHDGHAEFAQVLTYPSLAWSGRASTPTIASTDSGRSEFTLHIGPTFSTPEAEGGATKPRDLSAALTVRLFCEKILFTMAVCSDESVFFHRMVTRQEFTRGGGSNDCLPTSATISTCAEAWEITETAL